MIAEKPKYGTSPIIDRMASDPKWSEEFAKLGKLKVKDGVTGVDILSEAWYMNGHYIPRSFHSAIEVDDKFILAWFWKNKNPKLFRMTHRQMDSVLLQIKYTGPLGIICTVSKEDGVPYYVRFSPKFNVGDYLREIFEDNYSGIMESLEDGKIPDLNPSCEWFGFIQNKGHGPTFESLRKDMSIDVVNAMKEKLDMLRQWNYF